MRELEMNAGTASAYTMRTLDQNRIFDISMRHSTNDGLNSLTPDGKLRLRSTETLATVPHVAPIFDVPRFGSTDFSKHGDDYLYECGGDIDPDHWEDDDHSWVDVDDPYKQGQLDHLCGLYALINAINLCSHEMFIDGDWAKHLISTLLPMATELATTPKDGFIGFSEDELELMAKVLFHGLAATGHHYKLVDPFKYFRKPRERRLSKNQIFQRASKQSPFHLTHRPPKRAEHQRKKKRHSRCALIILINKFDLMHWSVVKLRSGKGLDLYDSSTIEMAATKYCRPWKVIVEG